jgi:hypothetical protein
MMNVTVPNSPTWVGLITLASRGGPTLPPKGIVVFQFIIFHPVLSLLFFGTPVDQQSPRRRNPELHMDLWGKIQEITHCVISLFEKGFCCSHIGKMLLELTVHIARLGDMMNMHVTGYWFWDAFGKQPRGKQWTWGIADSELQADVSERFMWTNAGETFLIPNGD